MSNAKKITKHTLVLLTVVAIAGIRNLPTTAIFGSKLIFFFSLGAIAFFIPTALVSAQLASTYSERGGIYIWVKKALGPQIALLAIWLQWTQTVLWYPTILAFLVGTIIYSISYPPSLDNDYLNNTALLIALIFIIFWGITYLNLRGIQSSVKFSAFCSIVGLFIPLLCLISAAIYWIYVDHPMQINFTYNEIIPDFSHCQSWVAMTSIMLSMCGIEIATVHSKDVYKPQKNLPPAIAYSTIIVAFLMLSSALSLAIVIPTEDINLTTGVIQATHMFLNTLNYSYLLPICTIMIVVGILGSINTWMISPTRGLLVAAQDGLLPQHMQKENKNNAPSVLLIYQAAIVSVLSFVFLMFPTVTTTYWMFSVLAAELYLFMYILMFISIIILHYKTPKVESTFIISGGTIGLWITVILGLCTCITTIIFCYIPPDCISLDDPTNFKFTILIGTIIFLAPPFLLCKFKQPTWQIKHTNHK